MFYLYDKRLGAVEEEEGKQIFSFWQENCSNIENFEESFKKIEALSFKHNFNTIKLRILYFEKCGEHIKVLTQTRINENEITPLMSLYEIETLKTLSASDFIYSLLGSELAVACPKLIYKNEGLFQINKDYLLIITSVCEHFDLDMVRNVFEEMERIINSRLLINTITETEQEGDIKVVLNQEEKPALNITDISTCVPEGLPKLEGIKLFSQENNGFVVVCNEKFLRTTKVNNVLDKLPNIKHAINLNRKVKK